MAIQIILTGLAGREAGREYVVADGFPCVVGRSRTCPVRLPDDPTVSRQHCILETQGPLVSVRDLGSKNGTYINGQNIGAGAPNSAEMDDTVHVGEPHVLRSGDYLALGANAFLVEIFDTSVDTQRVPFLSSLLALPA
jgi:pSer/pThr/pTyr-binding forkhead associated (FHA) protein